MEDLKLKVVRQVEYYFGDVNLLWDKYLNFIMDDYGWVEIEKLLKFNRLKALKISEAIFKDSFVANPSELVEISPDQMKVRRQLDKEISDDEERFKSEKMRRSIYALQFPKGSTLDELTHLFSSFGTVADVRMFKNHSIKGVLDYKRCAQILFEDEKVAQDLIKRAFIYCQGTMIRILNRTNYKHISQKKCVRIYQNKSGGDSSSTLSSMTYTSFSSTRDEVCNGTIKEETYPLNMPSTSNQTNNATSLAEHLFNHHRKVIKRDRDFFVDEEGNDGGIKRKMRRFNEDGKEIVADHETFNKSPKNTITPE